MKIDKSYWKNSKWVQSRFARRLATDSSGCSYRISSRPMGESSSQIVSTRPMKWSMHDSWCSRLSISTLGGRSLGMSKISTNSNRGSRAGEYQAKVTLGAEGVVGLSLKIPESFFTSRRTLSDMVTMCSNWEVGTQMIIFTATTKQEWQLPRW